MSGPDDSHWLEEVIASSALLKRCIVRERSTLVLLVLSVVSAVLSLVSVAQAADSDIVLSEIMINALTDFTGNHGEWIEICNRGTSSVDLTGWVLEDNGATNTIAASMCPNGSCEIPAGGAWLISSWSQLYLQVEFNGYTNPLSPSVDTSRTVFLGGKIGNGLANSDDRLILKNNAGKAVDCVSWDGSGTCSSLEYVGGGSGVDQNKDGDNGESIVNIQGQWYDGDPNASPYNCTNTAKGGSPTAVVLSGFEASEGPAGEWVWVFLSIGAAAALALVRRGKLRRD